MSWTGKEIAIIVTSTALGLVVVLFIGVNVAASFARRVLPSYAAVSETSQRLTDTDTQFPEVDCTPVEWRGDITRQKRYAEGLMSCLDEMWSPVVDKELDGGNLVTPHVDMRFYGDDAPVLCGEGAEEYGVSFYCSRNRTIRMWTYDGFSELDLVRVATHEYGHHLQEAMGLHSQLSLLSRLEEDPWEVMLWTKRLEAQAECLSGFSANHILPYHAEESVVEDDIDIPGEDPEDSHPSQANNRMWFDSGMQEGLSSCDTWSAPESEIR